MIGQLHSLLQDSRKEAHPTDRQVPRVLETWHQLFVWQPLRCWKVTLLCLDRAGDQLAMYKLVTWAKDTRRVIEDLSDDG
jgi:hypothetical protein